MNKKLLFFGFAFIFIVSSCNKCVECTQEDSSGDNVQYQIYDDNDGSVESYGDQIVEVCSDNFESNKDFDEYIEDIQKEYDYDCKSDFWN